MNNEDEQIREFLDSIPDNMEIMEEGIDLQTQLEYLDYSHSFGPGELSEEETLHLANILFHPNTALAGRKKALVLLAHLGSVTAFRQIEKYHKQADNELKQWSALALKECQMFLETALTGECSGFILGGLGGAGDKMRFYFLVMPVAEKPFTETQQKIIQDELKLVAKDLNCVVEKTFPAGRYVGLTVLVPMDLAVASFIEPGIKQCNELGEFVFEHYYVGNLNIPNEEEIDEIISIVRE